MIDVQELPLPQLLPPESAACSQCLTRLRDLLRGTDGIADAELDQLSGIATVHYDPNIISLPALEGLVQREGAHLGEAYAHREVPVEGMDCADCAMTLERGVGRLPGVTWVSINFAGARMSLEYEAHQTDMDAVSKRVQSLGYRLADGDERAAVSDEGLVRGFVAVRSNQITLVAGALTAIGGVLELVSAPNLASHRLLRPCHLDRRSADCPQSLQRASRHASDRHQHVDGYRDCRRGRYRRLAGSVTRRRPLLVG